MFCTLIRIERRRFWLLKEVTEAVVEEEAEACHLPQEEDRVPLLVEVGTGRVEEGPQPQDGGLVPAGLSLSLLLKPQHSNRLQHRHHQLHQLKFSR